MGELRTAIREGRFAAWRRAMLPRVSRRICPPRSSRLRYGHKPSPGRQVVMFWGKPGSAQPRFTNLKPGRLEAGAPPRGSHALYFGRTEPALPPPRPVIPEAIDPPRVPRPDTDGASQPVPADRRRLEPLTEPRDHRPSLSNRLPHRGQRQRRFVMLPALPHLRDPEPVVILRILRHDIAQTTRHPRNAIQQDRNQLIPPAIHRYHLPDQSIHTRALVKLQPRPGDGHPRRRHYRCHNKIPPVHPAVAPLPSTISHARPV